jgi:hypothetical protein
LEPVVPVVPDAPLMLEPPLLVVPLLVSDVPLLRDWLPEVEPPMPAPPVLPEVPPEVAALLPPGVLPMPPPVSPPALCAMVEPANAIAASSTAIEVFLMSPPCFVVSKKAFNVSNQRAMLSRTSVDIKVGNGHGNL